jgi:hypothetical protein
LILPLLRRRASISAGSILGDDQEDGSEGDLARLHEGTSAKLEDKGRFGFKAPFFNNPAKAKLRVILKQMPTE